MVLDGEQRAAFLESQPALGCKESFRFSCHPEIDCFNACCADLELLLGPYDVLRLRRHLALISRELMERHCRVGIEEQTGFPAVFLAMRDDPRRSCPFVTGQGCSVYADRPSACRLYPLGRGASVEPDGRVEVRWVVVREAHCHGHGQGESWTVDSWTRDQGLDPYLEFDDRLLRLHHRWKATGRTMDREQAGAVMLALYHLDDFRARAKRSGWRDRRPATGDDQPTRIEDDTELLRYAFAWLGRLLFGD